MSATTENMRRAAKGARGRPKEDRIVGLRRAVVRNREGLEDLERDFEGMVDLSPKDERTPHGRGVRRVAQERLDLGRKIEDAKNRISDLRAQLREIEERAERGEKVSRQKAALDRALEEQQGEETSLTAQLDNLPDLGESHESWKEMSADELAPRRPGRPPLPIEVRLARAENDLESAVAELNAEEKRRGLDLSSAEDVEDPDADRQRAGRPKLDALGMLDRKLKLAKDKLASIKDEPDQPKPRKLSRHGKPLGRKGLSKGEKIRQQMEVISRLEKTIESAEARLSPMRRAERELKKLRDSARELRAVIRTHGLDAEVSPEGRSLKLVEAKIKELKSLIDNLSKEHGAAARGEGPKASAEGTQRVKSEIAAALRGVEDHYGEIERKQEAAGAGSPARTSGKSRDRRATAH